MADQQKPTWWARVVCRVGGTYELGPLLISIHDHGACWAWRSVVKGEWHVG